MIQRIITITCSVLLVAMSLVVAQHWFSIRNISQFQIGSHPVNERPTPVMEIPKANPVAAPRPVAAAKPVTPSHAQEAFYTSLLKQVESLQNQNQDLLDQLAETNRELMKLEFRVDTHSSQFRPLPMTEERQDTGFDESNGVLPPRPFIIEDGFSN